MGDLEDGEVRTGECMKVLGLGSRESKIGSDIMQPSRYYSPPSKRREWEI